MAWKEVNNGAFPLKEKVGNKIEGFYQGFKERPAHSGNPYKIHKLRTDKGDVEFFGFTVVNSLLAEVQIGSYVLVEYLGVADTNKKPGKGNPHRAKVLVDDEKKETSPAF
jgi:hypothetical protein